MQESLKDLEEAYRSKMEKHGLSELRIRQFLGAFRQYFQGDSGSIREADIEPVKSVSSYETLDTGLPSRIDQVAVLKLNGGLATTMGLSCPKSLLRVKQLHTFLDLIVLQLQALRTSCGVEVPLILMNSPVTSAATERELFGKHQWRQELPWELMQSIIPKINVQTGAPASWPAAPDLEWCPPGHGDLYVSLRDTGLLEKLLSAGKRYLFVSNADNLGATLDPRILDWFVESGSPFLMEVALRTAADKKGGHLAARLSPSPGYILRELAQCEKSELDLFQDIERHRFFNTNNIWLDLQQIGPQIENLQLPLIVNRKTVSPSDRSSQPVVQLETAMGAAIGLFDRASVLRVPRARFIPVKKTADLLAVRSDLFELCPHTFHLRQAVETLPSIELDDRFFGLMADFEERFAGAVSLKECTKLQVKGNWDLTSCQHFGGELLYPDHADGTRVASNLEGKAVAPNMV